MKTRGHRLIGDATATTPGLSRVRHRDASPQAGNPGGISVRNGDSPSSVACNAFASGRWLDSNGAVDADARSLLQTAAERLGLSARGYHRVLKVARTIADLEMSVSIGSPHIAEALRYRPVGRPREAPASAAAIS